MKVKRTYGSPDEIPAETLRPFYVEKDGKYTLDLEIEGLAPASKIEEMRQTNITERQRHEDELKKFEGVDPEEYRVLKGRSELLDEKKLIAKGDVDSVVSKRVDDATRQFKDKEREYQQREARLRDTISAVTIENRVVQAAVPFGLRKGAAVDLIERARKIFKVNDDGQPVAYESDGRTPKTKLGDPYTIEDFVKELSGDDNTKHLFEDNAGGGGDAFKGGGGGGEYNGVNPFDPKSENRSEQNKLIVKNRPLAIKLAAKHGIKIEPFATTR